jgi:hypothetical protein
LLRYVDGFVEDEGLADDDGLVEDEGFVEEEDLEEDTCLLATFSVGVLLATVVVLLLDGREVALTSPSTTVLCIFPNKLKRVGSGFLVGEDVAAFVGLELEDSRLLEPLMVSN